MVLLMAFILIYTTEPFEHIDKINYYVITMRPEDRLKNIDLQQSKMREKSANIHLEYIDAVKGIDVDIDKMKASGELQPLNDSSFFNAKSMPNEVACYLSHMKTYRTILEKNQPGFSVIFEDDFELKDEFIEKLDQSLEILKSVDFDYCFLGMVGGGGGEHVNGEVYRIPTEGSMWQTHAYMVKNENIPKIINKLMPIKGLIDVSIFDKGKSRELNVYKLEPTIVKQDQFYTSIRVE